MTITSIGFIIYSIVIVSCFAASRQYAIMALFISALWIPQGQTIDIFGFHFYPLRLTLLLCIVRILVRREFPIGKITILDKTVSLWALVFLITSLLHKPDIFATRLGMIYNFVAPYFVTRCFITNFDSFKTAVSIAILTLIPTALLMTIEHLTEKNWFYILGGVEELSEIRDGRVRAQGPFAHPINAGMAGALTAGFALMFWFKNKKLAILGIMLGIATVYSCSSGGPTMALMIITGSVLLYRYRAYSKKLTLYFFILLFLLNLCMNSPVWYLIARVKVFGGSTAWHRAELINSSFKFFSEWWLAGTDYTRHWMPSGLDQVNADFADITSEYIWMMVAGGLSLFLVFVFLLRHAFLCIRSMRLECEGSKNRKCHPFEAWSITGVLLTFSITFLTTSYFDQVKIYWSFTLASISSWWASYLLIKSRTLRPGENTSF